MEWIECTLGDVLNFRRGYDLPHSEMRGGDVPVAGSNGVIGYHDVATSISPVITIGRSGNVGTPFMYEKAWAHNTTLFIDDFKGNDPLYLYYLIKTLPLSSFGGGSAVPTLNRNHIHPLVIKHCSDLNEQRRIAGILKSFDDKIALNSRINHNLEEQAQALYKSWFVDFEPFKDGTFVDSELGMIPEGWKIQSLDSLCSIISRGFSPNYNENSEDLVLGQRCVLNNLIDISLSRKHTPKNLGERELQKWDILINSTGMGSLGRVAQIYFDPSRLTFDSHLTLVRAQNDHYKLFLGRNLLSRQDEIENMAVGSTGQTELPRDRVRAMSILCPPESVVLSFGQIIRALSDAIQSNIEMNMSLSKDRDELLPKLMSGEPESQFIIN